MPSYPKRPRLDPSAPSVDDSDIGDPEHVQLNAVEPPALSTHIQQSIPEADQTGHGQQMNAENERASHPIAGTPDSHFRPAGGAFYTGHPFQYDISLHGGFGHGRSIIIPSALMGYRPQGPLSFANFTDDGGQPGFTPQHVRIRQQQTRLGQQQWQTETHRIVSEVRQQEQMGLPNLLVCDCYGCRLKEAGYRLDSNEE